MVFISRLADIVRLLNSTFPTRESFAGTLHRLSIQGFIPLTPANRLFAFARHRRLTLFNIDTIAAGLA